MRQTLLLALLATGIAGLRSELPACSLPQAAMRNAALVTIPDNTWVPLNATMPSNRNGGAEVFWAYDAANRVIVHYGGCTWPYTNEQWNFDLGTETWTLKYPHDPLAPPNLPAGGCSRGLAFDSKRHRVWINGGASNGGIGTGTCGLYFYDAATNTWTKAAENWGNPGRYGGTSQAANCLAYDSVNDLLVSIGRMPAGATVGDVWVYDIPNQIWNARSYDPVANGTGYVPLTFDPDLAQFVFFTGGSIWTYNAKTDVWTQKVTSVQPPGWRNHVGMAYDSRNKVHILYGGRGGVDDTWAYDARANTWTEMKPAQHPQSGIDTMLFSYDPEHNVCVLSDYRQGSPMWVYRYSNGGIPPPPPPATAPSITSQPSDGTLTAGQTATFTVTATGTAPLSYQWQRNGSTLAGARDASYTTPATTLSDSGSTFRVVVSNSAGSVTSNAAALTVNPLADGGDSAPPSGKTESRVWGCGATGLEGLLILIALRRRRIVVFVNSKLRLQPMLDIYSRGRTP